jgi:DNA-binding transcriptional ArsR family regulator
MIISRDDIAGALSSVIGAIRNEAEKIIADIDCFDTSDPATAVAITAARRIADFRLSGFELAALYDVEIAMRAEIVKKKLEPGMPLLVARWGAYGSALEPTAACPTSAPAGEAEYKAAEESIFASENRRARLAALPRGMTVGEILATDFPPPQWIVPELLTSGLTILAGAPKLGKSWLALALGAAVGSGGAVLGRYRVERRGAAYLALEDTPRRLKDRLQKIGAARDAHLDLFTQWRAGTEGIADLDAYLEEHPDVKLVLIDTLARFRGPPQGDDRYAEDYRAAAEIKAVADKHDAAIVVIHHVRKMPSEDVMDMVSGSNGLNGAADSTWVLTRARGEADAKLFITGRDVEEQSLALRFDSECGSWTVLGDAAEYAQSRERREILDALPSGAKKRTSEIAAAVGKKPNAVAYLLSKLEKEGLVHSPHYGHWARITPESPESTESESTPTLFTETESRNIQGIQDFQGVYTPLGARKGIEETKAEEEGQLSLGRSLNEKEVLVWTR